VIRNTLLKTQAATFCVQLPDANQQGMPTPMGTGFFVSPDGWFVTAAHVITENQESDGPVRQDLSQSWLMKEKRISIAKPGAMCQAVSFGHVIAPLDFALLKVDFPANANKDWLAGKTEFPFLSVSRRQLDEGEPVYSFGYPLSSALAQSFGSVAVGRLSLCPRVTSAIVSSTLEATQTVMSKSDPQVYVLDKALNYGNSGGPIVSSETGRVHAFCSRFQPVLVPQRHLQDASGNPTYVAMPSLYCVVSSLGNPGIQSLFQKLNVPLFNGRKIGF